MTVTVWQLDDPYHYAEVRGRVESTETGPEALAMINRLSQKYTGHDYTNPIQSGHRDNADHAGAPAVPLTPSGFWRGSVSSSRPARARSRCGLAPGVDRRRRASGAARLTFETGPRQIPVWSGAPASGAGSSHVCDRAAPEAPWGTFS